MRIIDINCDMGEGAGNDELLMPYISSANIACGYHAGNENEMKKTVALCLEHKVAIGAHPSFPDKENFGRTEMNLTSAQIRGIIKEQLSILNKITIAAGGKLHHVKLHGALYNMAAKNAVLAMTAAEAVKDFDDTLIYYGLSGSVMIGEALHSGLQIAREVFADRTYRPDGSLTPRPDQGAMITGLGHAINQVLQMINEQQVTATNGENISIKADTICIHGDSSNPVALAKSINEHLIMAGIHIKHIDKRKVS